MEHTLALGNCLAWWLAGFFSFFASPTFEAEAEEVSAGAKRLAIVANEEGVGLAASCWLVCELIEARPPRAASTESDLLVVSSVPAGAVVGNAEDEGA